MSIFLTAKESDFYFYAVKNAYKKAQATPQYVRFILIVRQV